MLASLGVAGDAERDLELVEDVSELVRDAVDDLFVRRFHLGGDVLFRRDVASQIARAVIENPDAEIPQVDRSFGSAVLRRQFAITLRERIREQKRNGRLVTYDDLLSRLAFSVEDPVRGAAVVKRLRQRFSMAIVDEFQDTDTVQWRILRAAFGDAPSRLVLVGDPKQSIYAFRGGDVQAYLQATRGAATFGLDVSWRSDQLLLDGLDTLFAGARLGGQEIRHRPLRARPGAGRPRLLGPEGGTASGAPFTLRILDRATGLVERTPQGWAKKPSTRIVIAADVAGFVERMLCAGSMLVERDGNGETVGPARPLGPGDVAVLLRRHRDAEDIRDALHAVGVPAVVHGGGSVFTTPAALDWLVLLRAIEQPAAVARQHAVAYGAFVGWDATHLATASEEEWEEIDGNIREWAAALRTLGVAGLLRRIDATAGCTARLLGEAGGERRLGDVRHVAELLHARLSAHPSSAAALAGWLEERIAEAAARFAGSGDDGRRRLESDDEAVTVQTIHSAKGLEFPVVLLPSLWEGPWNDDDAPPIFHDREGRRCIGVGGAGQLHRDQQTWAAEERSQEELRLLYVALTRARHRVVVWWATANDADVSPFARVLLGRDAATGAVLDRLSKRPDERSIRDAFAALAGPGSGGGAVGIEEIVEHDGQRRIRTSNPPAVAGLAVSRIERSFDRSWTRTSYSGLTAAVHDAGPPGGVPGDDPPPEVTGPMENVEADEATTLDEPGIDGAGAEECGGTGLLGVSLPLGDLPGGPRVGTLVHEVLERTDFAAGDLGAALTVAARQAGARRLLEDATDLLVPGLMAALATPLGPGFGDGCLTGLAHTDRLDELTFELPLAGGDEPSGMVTMDAIADVFAATLPVGDPLVAYHLALRDPLLAAQVRGFLTGSIDLVARLDGRYVVVDYKTNRLAPAGVALTAWHYRPDALVVAMVEAHYPLQAALYLVALHRYLRWRLAGYDPDRHLGGAVYLFLRGMSGPDAALVDGAPCGVFAWHPPAAFVIGLSDLLDRGAP